MKKVTGLIFLFVISTCFSNKNLLAQVKVLGLDQYIDYANIIKNSDGANNKYSDMKGSPFLNEEFETGKVYLRSGKIYEGPLRYDIYSDQIEFETKEGLVYEIKNPETVEKVTIGTRNFFSFVKEDGKNVTGIYEELVKGKHSLFSKLRVYLKDAVPAKPYVEARPATFIKKKSNYYLSDSTGELNPINTKKELLKLLDNPTEVKTFIKKNKINFNDEQDLISLVNYLNK